MATDNTESKPRGRTTAKKDDIQAAFDLAKVLFGLEAPDGYKLVLQHHKGEDGKENGRVSVLKVDCDTFDVDPVLDNQSGNNVIDVLAGLAQLAPFVTKMPDGRVVTESEE